MFSNNKYMTQNIEETLLENEKQRKQLDFLAEELLAIKIMFYSKNEWVTDRELKEMIKRFWETFGRKHYKFPEKFQGGVTPPV